MSTQVSSHPASPQTRHGLGPLSSNEIIIGLALGSPTENPLAPLPRQCLDGYVPPSRGQESPHEVDYSDNMSRISYDSPRAQSIGSHRSGSKLKRSGSRWRNLGGLFNRKAPSAPTADGQPFYMLDRPNQQERVASARAIASPEVSTASHEPRTSSLSEPKCQATCSATPIQESGARAMLRRVSTRRTGIRKRARAQTTGSLESSRRSPAKARLEGPEVPDERPGTSTWLRLDDSGVQEEPHGILSVPDTSSLLQVEIPSVELERYSVMFGDLLLPKSARSTPLHPSHKQSQLGELKPIPSEQENMPEERTLSPLSSNPPISSNLPRPPHTRKDSSSSTGSKSSAKSGHYGLFPSPSPAQKRKAAHKVPSKPSPLSRSVTTSNTTAAAPSRPTIRTSKSQDQNQLMIVVHKTETPSPPRTSSGSKVSGHHRRTSSFNPSDVSRNSINASYFEYIDDFEGNESTRPTSANGPRKEALPPSAFPVRKSSMKAPRVAPLSVLRPCPPLPVKTSSSHRVSDAIGSDGEVSIARQISISRRQRNLVPVMPQVARQPMQAKLVDSCSTPALRKSHHLTFEAVVDN